jgi:protein-tyrosine phosphatase
MERYSFEGIPNIRDLGGLWTVDGRRTKQGLLLRSGQLFFSTEGDLARLCELGIAEVIDLRSGLERAEKPDLEIPGARNLHLPIMEDISAGVTRDAESDEGAFAMLAQGGDDAPVLAAAYMQKTYRSFVESPFSVSQYARFAGEAVSCAERGRAILWHCTAGKDRAGFAAAIMLEALGVTRADIVEDYLLTNERLAAVVGQLIEQFEGQLPTDAAHEAARRLFLADESYLQAAYGAAEDLYGGFDAFLEQGLGLDAGVRAHMQELFLE